MGIRKDKQSVRIPPELPQIRVSVFENYFAQKPLGDVDLIKWCKTAKFKEQVIAFRTTSDEKVRQRIKRNLPCITPSGIFKTRSRDGLVQHTGFICIDIDHKDNGVFGPEWFDKKRLVAKTFDSLLCASMSISGNGLYLIFRIAHPDMHLAQFDALVREIYEKTGLVADQGCCDVCRLRGASYDAYPYINPHAKPYRGVLKERTARAKVRTAREKKLLDEKVYKLIKKIHEERKDITDDYHDWYCIGCALAHEYGKEEGLGYFIWSACTPRSITRPTATSSSPNVCGAGKSGSRPSYGFARNTGDVQVARRPAREAGTLSRVPASFYYICIPA